MGLFGVSWDMLKLKKLLVAYLKFKLNYISYVLSDDPNPQIGHILQLL